MQTTRSRFVVGDFIVEPQLNRITSPQGMTVIEPKVMHVLMCLAETPGDVLTRDALIEQVWEGTVVTDYVVSRSISQLRKILGDSFKSPRYIETVSKTGYRLIAPVTIPEEDAVGESSLSRTGDSHPRAAESIEVVPTIQPAPAHLENPTKRFTGWVAAAIILCALATLAWIGNGWLEKEPIQPFPSRLLTSTVGLEMTPAFSPDGSMVAYVRYHQDTRFDIYVKMIGEDTELRLTDYAGSDIYPNWSPDGRYLAYQRVGGETCGIYQIPAMGGAERKLMDCSPAQRNLDWSTDGTLFAVTAASSKTEDRYIDLIDVASLERRQITSPPPAYSDYLPVFSPDGSQVAFSRGFHGEIADLHVMPTTGGEPRRLTFDNQNIAGYTWTPDGKSIVFSSNRAGDYRLWQVDVSSAEISWVPGVATLDPGNPTISSTGATMVYEEWTFELNIWEVAVDAEMTGDSLGHLTQRFTSTRSDFQPHYAPDGERVAFVSNRSGTYELWVGGSDGSDAAALTSLDGAYLRRPHWSPDGRHIVFDAFVDGFTRIYVVDAESGRPQRLSAEDAEHRLPSWSRDGQWVYFTSNRDGEWQIWKMPAAGGASERVTSNGGYLAQDAPDGLLYYSKFGEKGIWRHGIGETEELVVADINRVDWGNWTVAGDKIYFFQRTPTAVSLVSQHLATREQQVFASFPHFTLSHESGIAVSPDGSRLLLSRTDRSESDIMLVEMQDGVKPW